MKKYHKNLTYIFVLFGFIASVTSGYSTLENPTVDYKHEPDSWWKKVFKPDVYQICRKAGTEPAFSGINDKETAEGVYYCACCGGDYPLYSSKAKFDSKTGWPSFWEPIAASHVIIESAILGDFFGREVKCARCESHLGHVFNDGPPPTGKRYCMNSLALAFVATGQPIIRTYSISTTTGVAE